MIIDSIKSVFVPVHKEGNKFILIFAVVTIILFFFSKTLGLIGIALTIWCALFFRDPKRVTPVDKNFVISPADGKISMIVKTIPPLEYDMGEKEMLRISIFMNVFNCHINRMPVSGMIKKIHYIPGKFLNAELDKASDDNERKAFVVEMENKKIIGMVQIAGLVARRIIGFKEEGDILNVGARFGMIRFGSRVDVYLPANVRLQTAIGQSVLAGETIIADLRVARKGTEFETILS